MARKRRLRQRSGARRSSQCKPNAMSSTDPNGPSSARPSSDGTTSEAAASDGAQTAMTSIMDTDEELNEELASHDGDVEVNVVVGNQGELANETASIYAPSHYPRASSPHRSEMLLFPADHRMDNSDLAASTRSLWAQDLDYRVIHGRRYCREYYMPNDEIEQLRLALMHQVFLHVLDGELTTIPLEDPSYILDVGTGTGEWAMRVAELFPGCDVVGTDIAAIAETRSVPMNVFFEIEDAEEWDRPADRYDLIHFRGMNGAFRDWRFIHDSAFYSLKPGAWTEILDFDINDGLGRFFSEFASDSPIHKLFSDLAVASEKSGRKRGCTHLEPQLLMESGFVDVRVTEYAIPITIAEKSIGKIWLVSCLDAVEAVCLRLLTEYMGWDPEKCKAACEDAARELAKLAKSPEKAKGLVLKMRVVVARKPRDATRETSPRQDDVHPSTETMATGQITDEVEETSHPGSWSAPDSPLARSVAADSGLGD